MRRELLLSEHADVDALGNHFAVHSGQQVGARRSIGQAELGVQRVHLEDATVLGG